MKRLLTFLCIAALCSTVFAQKGAEGIKSANIKGANLDLMKNHDPASELANFELMDGYQVIIRKGSCQLGI